MIYKIQNFVQLRVREAWKSKGQEAASGEYLCENQDSAKPPDSAGSHTSQGKGCIQGTGKTAFVTEALLR